MRADDPELYADLSRMATMLRNLGAFLGSYGDIFCVCRFGDDLGFKSATAAPAGATSANILIPQYRRVIELVHTAGKPFLLHSCGSIFEVMEDIIASRASTPSTPTRTRSPLSRCGWSDTAARIGNFGGMDTDVLCRERPAGSGE